MDRPVLGRTVPLAFVARSPDGTPTTETPTSTTDRTTAADPDRDVVVGPEGRLRFEPRSFTAE